MFAFFSLLAGDVGIEERISNGIHVTLGDVSLK
jgi:hypothetical protein